VFLSFLQAQGKEKNRSTCMQIAMLRSVEATQCVAGARSLCLTLFAPLFAKAFDTLLLTLDETPYAQYLESIATASACKRCSPCGEAQTHLSSPIFGGDFGQLSTNP
jgi:hypothetical protein